MNKKVNNAWQKIDVAVSGKPRLILGEFRLFSLKTRLIVGTLVAAVYLTFVLMSMPGLGSGITPDTASYLHFSPFRQPMYGMWANAIYAFSNSWRTVQILQVGAFIACSCWVIVELAIISELGVLSALLLFGMLLVFTRLGLLGLIGSLLSEGLFYPMIMLMVAMFLTWLRTRTTGALAGLALLLVSMTQLRPAALLVVAVPIFAALCVLVRQPSLRSANSRSAVLLVSTIFVGLVFIPPLFGKAILQIGTVADTSGRFLLGRVSLLPTSRILDERSADWIAMSSSWRAAAAQLDAVGLTQFDAQLQEAIQFELGPKVLLPPILNRSSEEIAQGWSKGKYYDDAKRIAIEWILDEWPTYSWLSSAHLWGMLTMANFMDNADRESVWKALNSVSELTWRDAVFRIDYPLNHIYKRLSWITTILYLLIRYVSIGVLILGVLSAITVLRQILGHREVSRGSVAVALAVGWSIAHSVPVALVSYPEFRYTYANVLVMFSGGATWLAYFGTKKPCRIRTETI
jgi:hypothetical protein